MIKKLPTSTEIRFDKDLDNMLLVQIPYSKFALLGEKKNNKNWKVSIVTKVNKGSRIIDTNMPNKAFAVLVSRTLAHPDQEYLKRKPSLTSITKHYKALLK